MPAFATQEKTFWRKIRGQGVGNHFFNGVEVPAPRRAAAPRRQKRASAKRAAQRGAIDARARRSPTPQMCALWLTLC
jgi:hypothetical protein